VAEVIAAAGLVTVVLRGGRVFEAQKLLTGRAGVDQVAPWGTDLHVIGQNGPALRATAQDVARQTGCTMTEAETSLEDVFIQLMGVSTDNMQ
jgi:ABC-2 type transport system ATP-binding protein